MEGLRLQVVLLMCIEAPVDGAFFCLPSAAEAWRCR